MIDSHILLEKIRATIQQEDKSLPESQKFIHILSRESPYIYTNEVRFPVTERYISWKVDRWWKPGWWWWWLFIVLCVRFHSISTIQQWSPCRKNIIVSVMMNDLSLNQICMLKALTIDRHLATRIHLDWSWLRAPKVKVNLPSTCTLLHRLLLANREHLEQLNHRWLLYPVTLRFHWRRTNGIKLMKFNYRMAKRFAMLERITDGHTLSFCRWSLIEPHGLRHPERKHLLFIDWTLNCWSLCMYPYSSMIYSNSYGYSSLPVEIQWVAQAFVAAVLWFAGDLINRLWLSSHAGRNTEVNMQSSMGNVFLKPWSSKIESLMTGNYQEYVFFSDEEKQPLVFV